MSGRRPDVVLINGPPGVGKSTTSRALAAKRPGTVCIEGDALRAFAPTDATKHLGRGATHRAAGALAAAYLGMGASRVVVDHCFLELAHVERALAPLDADVPVHLVTLWAPLAIVRERDAARSGREPLGAAVDECWHAIAAEPAFAERIGTDGVSPDQVVARVEEVIAAGTARADRARRRPG